jgi:hypothetical protein
MREWLIVGTGLLVLVVLSALVPTPPAQCVLPVQSVVKPLPVAEVSVYRSSGKWQMNGIVNSEADRQSLLKACQAALKDCAVDYLALQSAQPLSKVHQGLFALLAGLGPDGRVRWDGRRLTLGGHADNLTAKQALLDQARALSPSVLDEIGLLQNH